MKINVQAFLNSLPMMLKGMLGIFAVIVVIYALIVVLNKTTSPRKKQEQ